MGVNQSFPDQPHNKQKSHHNQVMAFIFHPENPPIRSASRVFRGLKIDWRPLVDMFRNKKAVVEVSLDAIESAYSSFGLEDLV